MHFETRCFRRRRVIAGQYLVAALISSGIPVIAASRAVLLERGNVVVGAGSSCNTAATFQGLGDLPGGSVQSWANAVSPDGSVVVGTSSSSSGQQAFRWTSGQGMVALGYLPGAGWSDATGASADGTVVVGTSGGYAFRWGVETGMVSLVDLSHAAGFGYFEVPPSVSADGSVVVGGSCFSTQFSTFCQGFRWTTLDGFMVLSDLPGGSEDSIATGVSADGSVIVGSIKVGGGPCPDGPSFGLYYDGFRWTTEDGMALLGLPPSCSGYLIRDVSADASTMVGDDWYGNGSGLVWSAGGGLVGVGDLPGGQVLSAARSVSGDGSVVVGDSESSAGNEAFIWNAGDGMRSVRAVLIDDHGIDLSGWVLRTARGVSDDGRTIVGYGTNPDGATEAWVATLPAVDSDGDGFPNDCDACIQSNLSASVIVGTCDTGVANAVDAGGCSMADSIAAACIAPRGLNRNPALASCVARFARAWWEDGLIGSDEFGRLVACAGRSGRAGVLRRLASPGEPAQAVGSWAGSNP